MRGLNPIQLMGMIKNGNPKDIATKIINENFANNPQMQTLLQLGEKGDVKSLEQFATQYLGQQGYDFNQEMSNLMGMIQGNK